MDRPSIKILAVSNVYCRLMNFAKAGDQELGHYHTYDHGTLLATGSLKVEILDDDGVKVLSENIFTAPTFMYIKKENIHRLTALEDNTVATCIHALRSIDEEIIDPTFMVEQRVLSERSDDPSKHDPSKPTIEAVLNDAGLELKPMVAPKHIVVTGNSNINWIKAGNITQ
jgi:hypothetical protein